MTCLRSKVIIPLQKKEALQLIPFLVGEPDSISMFVKFRIEDYLLDFLKN